jgi:conjugative relaxase-like TrwC/TraI family protein
MLRIQQQTCSAAARSYYTSRAEYYLGDAQELPSIWGGQAAEGLGLFGQVERADFDALCENKNPETGGKLTARNRSGRTVGYDFNFHPPKSLSVLYALTGRAELLDAFRSALASTVAEMEEAMQTRVRKRGQMTDRVTGNMLYSEHIHLTARPVDGVPDPHMHAHIFCFNATWDFVEGQWKASKIADIYRDAPYYQAVFHAHLAKTLAGMGYPIERKGASWEIAGLDGLLPKFSRRAAEIERLAAERGITDPTAKDSLGAATRKHKQHDATMGELRRVWFSRLDESDRAALANVVPATVASRPAEAGIPSPALTADRAIAAAVRDAFAGGAAQVTEKRLVASALAAAFGSLTADEIRGRLPFCGVATRYYGGQAFCSPLQQRPAGSDEAERRRFGGMTRREFDACTSRDAVRLVSADALPPGLATRQRSNLHLLHRQRQMHQEEETHESYHPTPQPPPRRSYGR